METTRALIKPKLLIWARETAGFGVAEAAVKLALPQHRLESWEKGDSKPTIRQLEKIARVYKRPFEVFYLPEQPKDFKPLQHDFRRLPGQVAGVQSPELRYEIRWAQTRREVALDLYETTNEAPPSFSLEATLTAAPEAVGHAIRSALGTGTHPKWVGSYDCFNFWRSKLEEAGILVFQAQKIDRGEMRGFSINERPLPVIVLNIKDSPAARTFTMVHELAHLMLREGGLCDLTEDRQNRPPEMLRTEQFCNMVAGATLVPSAELLTDPRVSAKGETRATWSDDELRPIAKKFGVSSLALLRRLLICKRTTAAFYQEKHEESANRKNDAENSERRDESGFAPPDRIAVSTAGPLFVRLVLTNYRQDAITASAVSDFLSVRLKWLNKIEAAVLGSPGSPAGGSL
jgi:Zn-dependent peptidase ImmA (M78 family)/transcriptional regulator with XRE-family HTH domain